MNIELQHLPVPELIPIRLTRQLTELMSPIGTAGLFRAIMIHTMNALRDNSDLLLSTMDVFIKEPLSEWMVSAVSDSSRFILSVVFMRRNKHSERVDKRVSRTKAEVCLLSLLCSSRIDDGSFGRHLCERSSEERTIQVDRHQSGCDHGVGVASVDRLLVFACLDVM